MVVMDYIHGSRPPETQQDYEDVEKAISLLHNEDMVFGDIRKPNIIAKPNGGAMLIDFDWVGKHQVSKYPASWSIDDTRLDAGTPASFGSESGADSWNTSRFSSAATSCPPTRAREHLLFGHHPYGITNLNDSTDCLSDAPTADSVDALSGIEFVLPTFTDEEPTIPKAEPKPEPDPVPAAAVKSEEPPTPARTQQPQHAPKPDPDFAPHPCKLLFPVLTTKPQTQPSLLPPQLSANNMTLMIVL
ncbi:hypothetical protein EWM64_g8122 [Hericium alpestre]|uniref:Protein kinase domain-containing protein n=1 Tax=Hericium alpestre TaxID=135208 RepID=A0A4Y9ZM85_9AGAM|nr:hypothetical protein EWM64_g8122 [Hericium alpestre]